MRIRWRLALFGAAVTTAALIAFAILLNSIVVTGSAQDQDELLAGIAEAAAASASVAGPGSFAGDAPPVVTDPQVSDQPFVVAVDLAGTVLYTTAPLSLKVPAAVVVEALETGASEATVSGIRFQARSFENSDVGVGIVAVGQSTRVPETQLAGFRAFLVIFGLITIVAATFASWLVTGRALRPLKTLVGTADEIASTGDLSRRLPSVRTKDEVRVLSLSFNGMLERLEEARAQLETNVESQRRFVADASHELRSPLTTIRSNAGFLRDHPEADQEDRGAAIADIEAEAERMSRLVNDLLLLARGDAGEEMERRPVALDELLADVARKARRLDGRLVIDESGPVVVSGDVDALTQLVWILVDNADNHGAGQIAVRVRAVDESATLTVSDEGPGLPEGDEERVFERFHQGDRARKTAGSGLGLSIAQTIVKQHGGSITATNPTEGGARILVMFPLI